MRNKRSHTKAERLVPLEAPGNRPRAIIAYDIAVLPWSSQGYRYVLVMVDLFSKQVEAWPMKEKEPSSLIGALENGWFNRHGIPNILLSDQEGAVDGQRIREQGCSVGGAGGSSAPSLQIQGGAALPHYKFKGDRRSLTLT